jgi:hypothetical protein
MDRHHRSACSAIFNTNQLPVQDKSECGLLHDPSPAKEMSRAEGYQDICHPGEEEVVDTSSAGCGWHAQRALSVPTTAAQEFVLLNFQFYLFEHNQARAPRFRDNLCTLT